MGSIDTTLLAVEELLYESPVAAIGAFNCPPLDPLFYDSGPAKNHIFVFPRTTVGIHHDGKEPFVATPHGVTFYNRGQHYTRRLLEPERGDVCDFFAVSPQLLIDAIRSRDCSVEERADQPFQAAFAEISQAVFTSERSLITRVREDKTPSMDTDESIVWLLDALLRDAAPHRAPVPLSRRAIENVEFAKTALSTQLESNPSIDSIARDTGSSLYHLCKSFRRRTGTTMSAYRLQLRLRLAFDEVRTSDDLLATAMRLGFSSHSYFTYAFRSYFGVTPSALRAKKRG